MQIEIPSRKRLPRKLAADARRSLFSGKRLAEEDEAPDSPMTKRFREAEISIEVISILQLILYSTIYVETNSLGENPIKCMSIKEQEHFQF